MWGGGGCGFGVLLFDPNTKTQCGSASIILMLELAQLEAELLKLSSSTVHDNCLCRLKGLPLISHPGVSTGRSIHGPKGS